MVTMEDLSRRVCYGLYWLVNWRKPPLFHSRRTLNAISLEF